MNKCLRCLTYGLILLFAHSCIDNNSVKTAKFDRKYHLHNIVKETEIVIQPPSEMVIIDSVIFLFRPGGCAAMLYGINMFDSVGIFGKMGRGPSEFISPRFAGKNLNSFYIFDPSQAQLYNYTFVKSRMGVIQFNLIKQQSYNNSTDITISNIECLNNEYKIARIVSGNDNFLALLDSSMNITSTFCKPFHRNDGTSIKGTIRSVNNQIVFTCFEVGYIASFEISDSGQVVMIWEYLMQPIKYTQTNDIDLERGALGFFDIKIQNNLIFVLYSGKPAVYGARSHIPNTILVFDLQGAPIAEISLIKPCLRFDISNDLKKIYGYELTSSFEGLVEYQVSDEIVSCLIKAMN